MSKKVAIINAYYPDYENEKRILAPFDAEVTHTVTGDDLEKTIAAARDADAVMTRETKLPREFMESLDHCQVIVRYGVGVDNIDLDAARECGIKVANVGNYGTDVVAEHAVALMFAAARRIVTRDADVRAGKWDIGAAEPLISFTGKTLGVIGCGAIGRAFIKKVSGLGFGQILGYDPYIKSVEGVVMSDLDAIFKNADVISLHMPLTPETRHMVNADRFAQMKNTAIIINDARGGLIDETALVTALKTGQIFAAGIDVFEQEPPEVSDELFSLKNVVVSDHTGWYAVESLARLQSMAAEEVARVFSGEEPKSWVNQ